MDEEKKITDEELQQNAAPAETGTEATAPELTPPAEPTTQPETTESAEPTARDRFRSRIAEDYPDLDIDDEDAYYNAANDRYDELQSFRTNTQNFRDALDLDAEERGTFNEMILAASKQKDFDPVIWLVENGGLDIDALRDDPDYARKLGEARKKYLDQISDGTKIEKEFEANAPASIEAINQYCQENGIDDDTKTNAIGRMYDLIDNLMVGKMPVELFQLVVNGVSHDEDVDYAREAGKAEGRQTKVSDKVRKLKKSDTVAPTQKAAATNEASEKNSNMFGL